MSEQLYAIHLTAAQSALALRTIYDAALAEPNAEHKARLLGIRQAIINREVAFETDRYPDGSIRRFTNGLPEGFDPYDWKKGE